MRNIRKASCNKTAQAWILWGIVFIAIFGSLIHFAYKWSDNTILVGIFSPVNESVWEHLKLAFWPVLFWWLLGYVLTKRSKKVSPMDWFVSATVAELTSLWLILSLYYTYTGALGTEVLVVDILSFILAVALGQVLALHIYKHAKLKCYHLYITITILLAFMVLFALFTFAPPHIPLFQDPLTGNFGIHESSAVTVPSIR